jgi:hypothetical protein
MIIDDIFFLQADEVDQKVAVECDAEVPAPAADHQEACPDCGLLMESRASLKVLLFVCEVLILFQRHQRSHAAASAAESPARRVRARVSEDVEPAVSPERAEEALEPTVAVKPGNLQSQCPICDRNFASKSNLAVSVLRLLEIPDIAAAASIGVSWSKKDNR